MDYRLPDLWDSITKDLQVLEVFRCNRLDHLQEYTGFNYSSNGSDLPNPINLLSLFVKTMLPHLVGGEPRGMCSTFNPKLRPYTRTTEENLNRRLKKINFGDTLCSSVVDAMVLMNITRIAITAPEEARFNPYEMPVGEVGVSTIDFEDFFYDTRAKKPGEWSYVGHFYEARYDAVKQSRKFARKPRLAMVPQEEPAYNFTGDDRVSIITRGSMSNEGRYEKFVRLCEVYFPQTGKILTFDADGDHDEPLLVQDWVGPKCGPYHLFFLGEPIPGQLLTKAPFMDLVDMHRSSNLLQRKLDYEASEAKTCFAYLDADDAEKYKKAKDQGWFQTNNPDNVKPITSPGPNQQVSLHLQTQLGMFNEHAGNIRTLGGLMTQASTATQESQMLSTASNLVRSMAFRTQRHSEACMNAISWYEWNHPTRTMHSEYRAQGLSDMHFARQIGPEDRSVAPHDDWDIQIDPYSLGYESPQTRIQQLDDMMKNVFLPILPMFGQPGVRELTETYVRMKARYSNNPDMIELWEKIGGIEGPPALDQAAGQDQTMPTETTRNYERVSRPGATDQGQQQILQQLMAGGQTNQGKGMEAMAS